MKRLKKLSEEVLHENPWWIYKHDQYEKPNGQIGDYYYAVTLGNSMIIPILDDGRIVLILQHRYINGRQSIEFPCGGRKGKNTFMETAKNELYQEAGCTADEYIKIGSFQALNGIVDDECNVFIAKVDEEGEQHLDDTEEIELMYRRPDEIDDMIKRNDIWDGQSMAAWAMARHHFFSDRSFEEKPALNPLHKIVGSILDS